jgi:hypothetical protein
VRSAPTRDAELLANMAGLERMLVVQLRNRGRILISLGRVEEGLDRIQRALTLDERIGGAAMELSQAHTEKDAARALLVAGRDAEAGAFATTALTRVTRAGADDADTLVLLSTAARMQGNAADARALAERARTKRATRVQHGVIPIVEAMLAEAESASAAGDGSEASRIAARAVAMLEPAVGPNDPRVLALRAIEKRGTVGGKPN